MNEQYVKAILSRLQADIDAAKAGLELYLSTKNLSAIGEHRNLIDEQLKFVRELTEAEDALATFQKFLDEKEKGKMQDA